MTSPISSRVTPLASARSVWTLSWSGRYSAMSAATVMRLRSRLERPGRSQMSGESSVSDSSMRRGTTARTSLRADEVLVDVLMLPPVGIGEFGPGPTPETRRIFSRGRRLDHRGGPPMTDRSHVAQNDAERQRLSALVARLSDQELARPLPAGWTVATVLGHVAFWDQRVIEIIAAWRRAGVGAPLPALAEANVDWIND